MKLLIDYKGRKYGTGGGVLALLHDPAACRFAELLERRLVEIRADFGTPIEGHAEDTMTSSKAVVIGADILLDLREAEEFAKALLHTVEHARRVSKGQIFKF